MVLLVLFLVLFHSNAFAQTTKGTVYSFTDTTDKAQVVPDFKALYGTASYYADKFNGRETANGDHYSHYKMTAACNKLPLNTWIRVTNLRNKRTVIVQVNDRLHPRNPRIVDLSRMAAEKLGYIGSGLTQVKVEVLLKRSLSK